MTVANEMSYQLDSPQVDLNCDRVVFNVTDAGVVTQVTAPTGYAVSRTAEGEYTLNVPQNFGDCMVIASSNIAGETLFSVDYTDSNTGEIVVTSLSGADPASDSTISLLIFLERSSES